MTAAVYRTGTPLLDVPESQNTAPVLEFNCLYTHDIRRKQKRWQDGFLRFHTFNKRVMVYDVPRNFIGDAHWKSTEPLQDGDEVTLEKGGVIVQVAESVGRTETDLTELRQRKSKNSSVQGSSSPVRAWRAPMPSRTGTAPALGLKHRSLNALLGTPKGPIGKAALPTKSPFEERQADLHSNTDDRPAKRQRIEPPPPQAWNVVRTAKQTTTHPKKETPLWARTSDSTKKTRRAAIENAQRTLATKEVIDLCGEEDETHGKFLPGFSSDALAPSSPPRLDAPDQVQKTKPPIVRSSSPAFQTQKVRAKDRSADVVDLGDTGDRRVEPMTATTPNIRRKNLTSARETDTRQSEVADTSDHLNGSREASKSNMVEAGPSRRPESKSGRTLRIAASAPKKKMLLCQDQLLTGGSRSQVSGAVSDAVQAGKSRKPKSPTRNRKSQQEQLQAGLARIASKERNGDHAVVLDDDESSVQRSLSPNVTDEMDTATTEPELGQSTSLQQNAMELAELDQMIMPTMHSLSPVPDERPREPRELRRVVSKTSVQPNTKSKRIAGAPVRYTPSPAKRPPSAATSVDPSESEASPVKQAPVLPAKKLRSKKSLQRAVTLNTASNGTSTVILSKPFQTPKAPVLKAPEPPRAPEPWSREAFDLFTWRPPQWDEENWCIKADAAT